MDGGAPRKPTDAVAAIEQSLGVCPIYRIGDDCNGGLCAAKWRLDTCRVTTGNLAYGILAFRTSGSAAVTRCAGGESVRKRPPIGSATFAAADTCARWTSDGSSEALHIYIPQARVRCFTEQELYTSSVPRIEDFFAITDPWLQGYFQMLTSEFEIFSENGEAPDSLFLAQTEHLLLRHLLRWHSDASSPHLDGLDLRHALNPLQSSIMRRVHEYIDAHLAEDICLQDLADLACMSAGHFLRGFRVASGTTPYQYVLEQRLQKARSMLSCGTEPISRIALQCGFKTLSHMSSKFHGRFGMSPSNYRAECQMTFPAGNAQRARRSVRSIGGSTLEFPLASPSAGAPATASSRT
jgi:AraC family transcriptional regulator